LIAAMILAVASFAYTLTLSPGDVIPFAVICVLSGATIGADLTLLPAMFAKRMAAISPNGGQGFGLWNLVNKFTLSKFTPLPGSRLSHFVPKGEYWFYPDEDPGFVEYRNRIREALE